jgi:hypothetical protein
MRESEEKNVRRKNNNYTTRLRRAVGFFRSFSYESRSMLKEYLFACVHLLLSLFCHYFFKG